MAIMKLYEEEDDEIVYRTQLRDPFFQQLTEIIFSYVDRKGGGRVLDLGCGAGRNLREAVKRGHEAVGVDSNEKSLRVAKKYIKEEGIGHRVKLIHADITKFRKRQLGFFDYVILQEVIEHVEDYQKVIDFAHSSLKKGGKILITTPHDPKQWNLFDEYAEHVRRFKISKVCKAIGNFSETRVFTIGFPVHRLTQFVYLKILKLNHSMHQARTFRKNKWFHVLYYTVGRIMIKLDLLFCWLPLGTTVVAIGTK